MTKRVVVCAANMCEDVIVLGARHFDELMHSQIKARGAAGWNPMPSAWKQGFIDQHGVFMDRKEALQVATDAGQIGLHRPKNPGEWLCSEDLY